jgi:hypothetical protein
MQNQSQSTQRHESSSEQSGSEPAPELQKQTKTMSALLWPALTVLAIAIVVILIFALR